MNSSILEQRNRFALIGVLMTIVSLMFLFYMGSSLVSSTKKYLEQIPDDRDNLCGRIKEKAVKQDIRRKSLLLPEENKKPYGREKQSMENGEQQIPVPPPVADRSL